MATTATQLLNARLRQGQNLDVLQQRALTGGLGSLMRHKADTNFLLNDQARSTIMNLAPAQDADFVVFQKPSVDGSTRVSSSRTCNVASTDQTTNILNFSRVTMVASFSINWRDYLSNEYGYEDALLREMSAIDEMFAVEMNTACESNFFTTATQTTAINAKVANIGGLTIGTNQIVVPLAEEYTETFASINPIMDLHDMGNGQVFIVTDAIGGHIAERLSQDASSKIVKFGDAGVGTDTAYEISTGNEGWQLSNKTIWSDNKMTIPVGNKTRMQVSKPGTFGIIPYYEPLFGSAKGMAGDSNNSTYELTGVMPITGYEFMVRKQSDCLNGQNIVDSYEVSLDYYIVNAWNHTPASESIGAFDIVIANS